MTIREITGKMKMAAPLLAAASCEQRNEALAAVRDTLLAAREEIFAANRRDLERAAQTDVPAPVQKRLRFDEKKPVKYFVSSRNCRTFALAFGKFSGAGLRKGVFRGPLEEVIFDILQTTTRQQSPVPLWEPG